MWDGEGEGGDGEEGTDVPSPTDTTATLLEIDRVKNMARQISARRSMRGLSIGAGICGRGIGRATRARGGVHDAILQRLTEMLRADPAVTAHVDARR